MTPPTKTALLLLITGLFCASMATTTHAGVDWTMIKEIRIEASPLDIATSPDGDTVFVLTPGEILVYSAPEGRVASRIPVEAGFDRIMLSANGETLALTASSSKLLRLIRIERVFEIDITGLPFDGPENAPVTIAVFDDYQCPYCARLEQTFRQVMEKYPHQVKLVIKHFPLRSHQYAQKAAKAALAAGAQGKFREFHGRLFEIYDVMDDSKIDYIARELALDFEKFKEDMNGSAIQALIHRDIRDGVQAGVRGTPTVFINGKLLKNKSLQSFHRMIEDELSRINQRAKGKSQ